MLDNLRDQSSFQPEEEQLSDGTEERLQGKRQPRSSHQKAGLTAPQRFILSLLLFMMVCLAGVVLLVITGKVVLPFGF